MTTHKSKSRQARPLNHLLNHRLVSYAAGATAAAAGCLGLAQPADAQIVYTPAHVVIVAYHSYGLDVNNDGKADFLLHASVSANCSTVFNLLLAKPVVGNAVEGADYNGLVLADAEKSGETIGSSRKFVNSGRGGPIMGEAINSPGGGQLLGNWANVVNRYLGLKFQINGQTHFGWARFTVKSHIFTGVRAVLTGYAYESQPNTPITAGQKTGTPAQVPLVPRIKGDDGPDAALRSPLTRQPASLGALALGAVGLSLWRRDLPAAA